LVPSHKTSNIYLYFFLWLELRPTLSFGCSFASPPPPYFDDWYRARSVHVCYLRHMVNFYMLGLSFCWRVLIELNTPPRVYNTHTHCAPTTYELNRGSKYQTLLFALCILLEKVTIWYILLLTLCIFLGLYTLFNILVFSLVSYDELSQY
jgi:hypothetical protein